MSKRGPEGCGTCLVFQALRVASQIQDDGIATVCIIRKWLNNGLIDSLSESDMAIDGSEAMIKGRLRPPCSFSSIAYPLHSPSS